MLAPVNTFINHWRFIVHLNCFSSLIKLPSGAVLLLGAAIVNA
jgi:hypothetical protein